jgi:hypothetical protein
VKSRKKKRGRKKEIKEKKEEKEEEVEPPIIGSWIRHWPSISSSSRPHTTKPFVVSREIKVQD